MAEDPYQDQPNVPPSQTIPAVWATLAGSVPAWVAPATLGGGIASVGSTTVQGFGELASSTTALERFHVALANRNYGPCDILGIGDSIGEGVGPTARTRRWWDLLRDQLRARYTQTAAGGYGYIPAQYGFPTITTFWTFTGGSQHGFDATAAFGLGRRTNAMTTTGDKMVGSITCTAFDVFFAGDTGSGVGYYKVDGGAPVTFPTVQGSSSGGHRVQVTGLSAASHTIEVGWSSGGTVTIEGIMVYNGDESAGIRMWDGFHSSEASPYWVSPNTAWQATVSAVQPALVMLEFGINDATLVTGTAQMIANLQALIASINALCTKPPSYLIVSPWPNGAKANGLYAPYYAALRAFVTANSQTVAFFDMAARVGYTVESASATDALGVTADTLHPNDKGSQMYADALLGVLSP